MNKLFRTALPALLIASLAGCAAQTGATTDARPEAVVEIDSTINDVVISSVQATNEVAAVDVSISRRASAEERAEELPPTVVLPDDAVQPVTVDWNGPIEGLFQHLANRAGYAMKVTGKAPANNPPISITANEEPLFGVVRRAGALSHEFADVSFNPAARLIEIRYKG